VTNPLLLIITSIFAVGVAIVIRRLFQKTVPIRLIRNASLGTMISPIRHTLAHLHKSIINVAPEQTAAFDAAHRDFTLELVDDYYWICDVRPTAKYIRISRRVAELLWCAGYAYFTLYLKVFQGVDLTQNHEINLNDCPNDVKKPMHLLLWAWDNFLSDTDNTWPRDLPQPFAAPAKLSTENVADEISLTAVAFLLHHELAHIRLNHDPSAPSPAEERCAAPPLMSLEKSIMG
jgi:hypothetical protein